MPRRRPIVSVTSTKKSISLEPEFKMFTAPIVKFPSKVYDFLPEIKVKI